MKIISRGAEPEVPGQRLGAEDGMVCLSGTENQACLCAVQARPCQASSGNWYAVYTKCHHEFTIWSQLQKKAIENFFPCVTRWSRRRDRKLKIQAPLFPGYLFVRLDFTPYHALEVLKIDGVVRFLETNQRPVAIPDIQIESLQAIIRSGEQILAFPYFQVGQRVRVGRGPFEECEGMLVRMKTGGADRLVISLELMKRSVAIEIDSADVVPL